ncbi:MAG: MBL fold metallo-hydrolase [bacterium]|nr:MBL fold metallo-hydrolase [bacterium]
MKIKSRQGFVRIAGAALLLSLSTALGCEAMVGRIVEASVDRQTTSIRSELLEDDALRVFLCGTGSPLPDADSAAACTVVIAGGRVYVIDVGPGSQEVAQLAGIPTRALGGVFLTHFHSDHIGELGEWATQSWIAGRTGALHVYGPPGIDRVVGGFKEAYRQDDEYRITHHGLENLPRTATEWLPHTVPYESGSGTKVLDEGGLVVTAFGVDHKPVEPAVGYRFDYKGRSVVISGDTDKSSNLESVAEGADLLIHEVLIKSLISQVSDATGEAGRPRLQRLSKDILDYHTSPSEAAESANAAGVDTLVFTHLVPPVPVLREWFFMREVEAGDVDVMLGEDGMMFRLPVGSDSIDIGS